MKVILAESAGFCWGVRRAVEKARQLTRNHPSSVFTDGPLIHNQQMMEQLRREGVIETDNPAKVSTGVMVIRAHGIPPHRRQMLENLPIPVVDATCPDVARIQGLIRKYARKGYSILIYGDKGHAEVDGLLGYAEGKGTVVSHPDDVSRLPDMNSVCVVSQSTQFPTAFARTTEAVLRRFPDALVIDTICESTRNRQKEIEKIAGIADAIVVVGSAHSANTIRLVELARSLKPTFHIETADRIAPEPFREFRVVGLTAGASTPAFAILDVKRALEAISGKDPS